MPAKSLPPPMSTSSSSTGPWWIQDRRSGGAGFDPPPWVVPTANSGAASTSRLPLRGKKSQHQPYGLYGQERARKVKGGSLGSESSSLWFSARYQSHLALPLVRPEGLWRTAARGS